MLEPSLQLRTMLTGLYGITDSEQMPFEQLFCKSEAALRGGCRVLQYRDKSASPTEKIRRAIALLELCQKYHALFVVNDDIALAHDIGAPGIHLGQGDASVDEAKRQLGDQTLVGVSCHGSLLLAQRAEQQGASYVAFGRFFESRTKPEAPPASLQVLVEARQRLRIPVVAIGGITRDNARLVIQQGANMIAVVHDLFAGEDVEARARQFAGLFHE